MTHAEIPKRCKRMVSAYKPTYEPRDPHPKDLINMIDTTGKQWVAQFFILATGKPKDKAPFEGIAMLNRNPNAPHILRTGIRGQALEDWRSQARKRMNSGT